MVVGLERNQSRDICKKIYDEVFSGISGYKGPHEYQYELWEKIIFSTEDILVSVRVAGGKTYAIGIPSLVKILIKPPLENLILVYPTKVLVEDQKRKFEKIIPSITRVLTSLFGVPAPNIQVGIDTGDEKEAYFYNSHVILTTFDTFVHRLFAYAHKRWNMVYPMKIARSIIVFDEAHSYESIAFLSFVHVIRNILKVKQKHPWFNPQLIAMSATLPSPTEELLDFFHEKFRGGKFLKERGNKIESGKRIYGGEITKEELVTILRHSIDSGKRSLIVVNEVWFAVELYDVLCKKLGSAKDILLYHGRQLVSERRKIVEDIVEGKWLILISTSACEVGLDVNADVLVTTLCPPDSFIQRVGRCARKPGQVGTVYLLVLKSLQDDKEITCREFGVNAEDLKYADSLQKDSPINLDVISSFIEGTARKLVELYGKIQAIPFPLAYNIDIIEKLTKYVYEFVEENSYVHLQIIQCLRNFEPEVRLLPLIRNEDEAIDFLKDGDYIRLPLYRLFVDEDASIKAESLIKGADINSTASVTYTLDGDYEIRRLRRIVYNESPLTILISNKEKRELSTKGYVGVSGPRAKKDEKIDILLGQDEMGSLQVRAKFGKNVIDHLLPASYPLLAYFLRGA